MAAAPARDFSSHITFAGRTAVAGRPPRSGDPWAAGRIADDAVLDKLGVGSARKADGLLTEAARSSEGLVMLFSNCQPLCVGGTAPQPLFLPAREALAALGITECVTSDAAARGPAPASPIEGTDVVSALLGVLTLLSDGAPAGQSAPSHPRAKDGAAAVLRGSLGEASVGGVVAARPLLAVDVGMQGRLERPDDAVLAELLGRLSAGGLACKGMAGAPAGPLSGILGDGERAAFLPPRALMAMPEEAAATAREALAAVDAGSSSALDLLATALPRSGPAPAAAGLFAQARSLLIWHRRSAMCGACGGATAPYDAGVKRSCAACGTRNYPRTDSVAIAAVLHGAGDDEHLLVGRQAGWPPGMHSCLSGFVDAGETLEEAVRREIGEEAGIAVGAVRLHASQPWPLPRGTFGQLMLGAYGRTDADQAGPRPDAPLVGEGEELDGALWMGREDAARALLEGVAFGMHAKRDGGARPFVPGPYAIAHHLVRDWVDGGDAAPASRL